MYVVWFSMFPGDSRARWPGSLMADPRVAHFWDENKHVGRFYGENVTSTEEGHVEWDAYFLYRPGSSWGASGPDEMVSWGRTVVDTRKRLESDLKELLARPTE